MSLSDELQKLADLYDDGVLTEQEFAAAKRRLIQPTPPKSEKPPADPSLGEAANKYVDFQIVMGVIGLLLVLLFFFLFWLPAVSRMH